MAATRSTHSDLIEVRRSKVHGLGVFAKSRIPKGARIIEYVGDRVSHAEADRRYEDKEENDSHTFLFIVDAKTVIDAGVDGNDARFFNHSCDPNCESVVENKRVYIEALRAIEPGAELTYDYQIQREDDDPANIDEVFACRCGFAACRGTMLWPTERKPRRKARKKKSPARGKRRSGKVSRKRVASGKRAGSGKSVVTKRAGRRR
jgi:SET domain-containing protein